MKAVLGRASYFLRGVSKDTHIWGVGIMLGAILLSISFFLEPDEREFLMQSVTVNAAEKATAFVIPDCFNMGSIVVPDEALSSEDDGSSYTIVVPSLNVVLTIQDGKIIDSSEYIIGSVGNPAVLDEQLIGKPLSDIEMNIEENTITDSILPDIDVTVDTSSVVPQQDNMGKEDIIDSIIEKALAGVIGTETQVEAEKEVADLGADASSIEATDVAAVAENIVLAVDNSLEAGLISEDLLEDISNDESSVISDSADELSEIPVSVDEYEALCRIVATEANTEDMEGQIMVANVILNRVQSDIFPDNIIDVIEDPGQFAPVSRGSYKYAKASRETKEAVMRAINGEDYTEGALYFQKSISKKWGNKTFLFRHGDHSFYR